jgi:hypothetical protein
MPALNTNTSILLQCEAYSYYHIYSNPVFLGLFIILYPITKSTIPTTFIPNIIIFQRQPFANLNSIH